MQAMSYLASCPFLNRTSFSLLKSAGRSLDVYAARCPAMRTMFHTGSRTPSSLSVERVFRTAHEGIASPAGRCPFRAAMQKKSVSSKPADEGLPPSVEPKSAASSAAKSESECKCHSEGLQPQGNCPFRWKDFIASSVKDTVSKTFVSPAPPTSSTNTNTIPRTVDGKPNYNQLFEAKIEAKKSDNTYRKFRVMARSAGNFPNAKHFPDPSVPMEMGRDVTVWCSNDYMGMSKHPEVIKAAV